MGTNYNSDAINYNSGAINYNSAAGLEAFLNERGLGMRKKYGQNFLINPDIRSRLVTALDAGQGSAVWEIGPGLGAMTQLLLERNFQVTAFEIDPGFIGILHELFDSNSGFTLVEGDVMKTYVVRNQADNAQAPYLLGNLPYNIAAALIGDMIEKQRFFDRMVLTVQKELAQRMTAAPGSANYSSFSVLCASAYRISKLVAIPASSFYPRPRVDSWGVKLERREDGRVYPPLLYPLVRALFSSRRKIIKNNLNVFVSSVLAGKSPDNSHGSEKSAIQYREELCSHLLEENSLLGTERAENLSLETFTALAGTLDSILAQKPE
ncbi:MAG: 16S rRNA (adenine(1518)-N(6)/adenine(1519)-N(6))-dimethyltransferase RsmA [Treponema sp.]|nr:16S rRNA (adenine(1518)-N(6)/adenine(1519)-N(6))-dimethyltransferase RsmA [Treponema sp.]